jgi:hypothetical protein
VSENKVVFVIEICVVFIASPIIAQSIQEVVGGSQHPLVYMSPKPSNESDGIVSIGSNEAIHTMDVWEGPITSNASNIGSNEADQAMDVLEGIVKYIDLLNNSELICGETY